MGFPSSNIVRLIPRDAPSEALFCTLATKRREMTTDLSALDTPSLNLALLKGALIEAIARYSRDCVAAGGTDPSERLCTMLRPVETLEVAMHRLASAMAAHIPR